MLRTAWRFIIYDKAKSIGALLGVVISIFLIGQQTGIFIFLTNAMANLANNLDADIVIVDSKTTNINALGQIDVRNQRQIAAMRGVAHAYPLVIAGAAAKFQNGTSAGVTLVGSQAPAFVGGPWNISSGSTTDLLQDNAVSADIYDRKLLGGIESGSRFEISGKRAFIAVQTKGVRGFGASYVFTTIERARYYGNFPQDKISAILVRVDSGYKAETLVAEINKQNYGIRAWTKKDFSAQTVSTVLASSGIATSIGTLIIFAVIAGSFIIGLTLYSAATDRLKDYATLKAIGATNAVVRNLILTQAAIFAIVGYLIGLALMEAFRFGIGRAGVMFSYTPLMYIGFAAITLFISFLGVIAAIRRITQVEPASVFRG
jgi:putative ABC transport system permease protein